MTTQNEVKTPRTDDATHKYEYYNDGEYRSFDYVFPSSMMELELELQQIKAELEAAKRDESNHPRIVCLCGSTRFGEAFREWNLRETIAGKIVLSIGCNLKSDSDLIAAGLLKESDKVALDELHKRKIDLADEILVLNVGGYIGTSTRSEIDYALLHNKSVRYLEAIDAAMNPPSGNERKE